MQPEALVLLRLEFDVPEAGRAELFFASGDETFRHGFFRYQHRTRKGKNRLNLVISLPKGLDRLRFDPGQGAGIYSLAKLDSYPIHPVN
jgi:hypothetical protein